MNEDTEMDQAQESKVAEDDKKEDKKDDDEDEYFDDPRESVHEFLQKEEEEEESGSFAVGGDCKPHQSILMPGLVVNDIGPIGLPLSARESQLLAKICQQAPFGRGSDTVVDTTVRNTKQLAPEHFKITNPQWKTSIDELVSNIKTELGVPNYIEVEAQLYKLLVYEKGSFFKMHRDSEKIQGMFGTLVVVLPSIYSGGELVVKHQDATKQYFQSHGAQFKTQYAAFYADCQHELKEVTGGCRLCLVYNLVKVGRGPKPTAAKKESLAHLGAVARAWAKNFDGNKLVIMAKHLYTPAGMKGEKNSAKFKGKDATIARLLERAQDEGIDLDWDHGIVSVSQFGYADGDDDDYYGGPVTWEDPICSLKMSSGDKISLSLEKEMMPPDFFENRKPLYQKVGPTGNEGVQADRQYKDQNAIVVWPRSRTWEVTSGGDVQDMASSLLKMCQSGSVPMSECKTKATILCQRMLESLAKETYLSSYKVESALDKFIDCLVEIKDKELANNFFEKWMKNDTSCFRKAMKKLATFVDAFGCEILEKYLLQFITEKRFKVNPDAMLELAVKCWNAMVDNEESVSKPKGLMAKKVVEQVVNAIPSTSFKPTCSAEELGTGYVRSFISLFISPNAIPDGTDLVCRFIKAANYCISSRVVVMGCSSTYRYLSNTTVFSGENIVELCQELGWKPLESVLMDTMKKYCDTDLLVFATKFLRELALPVAPKTSDRFRICFKLAKCLLGALLDDNGDDNNDNDNDNDSDIWQKPMSAEERLEFLNLIDKVSPGRLDEFINYAKKLDMRKAMYPFVVALYEREDLKALQSPGGRNVATELAKHCAEQLSNSEPVTAEVQSKAISPNTSCTCAHIPLLIPFLNSHCKDVLDMQLSKKHHKQIARDLKSLVDAEQIRLRSHQPKGYGPWNLEITKIMPPKPVAVTSVSGCKCYRLSNSRVQSKGRCLLHLHSARVEEFKKDKEMLAKVLSLLPKSIADEIRSTRANDNEDDEGNKRKSTTTRSKAKKAKTNA